MTLQKPLLSTDFMGDLSAFHEGDSRIGAAQQTGQAQAGDEDKTPQGFHTFSNMFMIHAIII